MDIGYSTHENILSVYPRCGCGCFGTCLVASSSRLSLAQNGGATSPSVFSPEIVARGRCTPSAAAAIAVASSRLQGGRGSELQDAMVVLAGESLNTYCYRSDAL